MKTKLFLVLGALIIFCNLHAQRTDTADSRPDSDTTSWQYKMETNHENWVRLAKKGTYQLFTRLDWKRANMKGKHTANINRYGNGTLFMLNDVDLVELAAAGITAQNAGEFIYHVVENDSIEIVPWTRPQEFHTNDKITYAYLGKFNTRNRIVRVELYDLKHYYDRSLITFNDLFLPKAQLKYVTLNYNNKYLFRPYQQHYIPTNKAIYYSENQQTKGYFKMRKDSISGARDEHRPALWKLKKGDIVFKWSDSINHLAIDIKPTLQNDIYNVYLKRTVNGKTDTVYISNDWSLSYYSPDPLLRVNSSYFNRPGEYELIVTPELPDEFKRNTMDNALIIPFTVLPAETRAFSSMQVAMIIGSFLLVIGGLFTIYHFINKRRLAKEAQQKEIALLQLQSVRSQLNPHFMFNALAGIQNLVNKHDADAANVYMSKFARLTRYVLDDSKKDMVDIAEERGLLETYLQMEQMRFGFKYDIFVDEKIDQTGTEIPAMLFQPFVENAVKYGVSSLNGNGEISIHFKQEGDLLRIIIQDNGKGFTEQTSEKGNGTRLSAQRISLLNRLDRKKQILLATKSGISGTVITIQLNGYHAFNGD